MQLPICLVMNPTPKELKIAYIAELFLRGDLTIVEAKIEPPRKKTNIDDDPPHTATSEPLHTTSSSSWTDFQNQILEEVKSMNDRLSKLEEGQKNNGRLLRQVLGMLYNINDNVKVNPTTSRYAVCFRRQVSPVSFDSDYDCSFVPGDDGQRVDVSDIKTVACVGVEAATGFLFTEKVLKIVSIFLCKLLESIYYRRYNTYW